jgi:Plant mobile domain
LSFFLSFFIFTDYPSESLSRWVFPLAARLAGGVAVPLGPFFLGHLYRQLDQARGDQERSAGRYDVSSMINTSFLLAFFFEHFRPLRPTREEMVVDEDLAPFLIERWSDVPCVEYLAEHAGDFANFRPRPYSRRHTVFMDNSEFLVDSDILLSSMGAAAEARAPLSFRRMSMPGWLPVLGDFGQGSVAYRTDRVARQFGYDQGSTSSPPRLQEFAESQRRFLLLEAGTLVRGHRDAVIPRSRRAGMLTPSFRLQWRRNLDSFLQFVQSPAVRLAAEVISPRDPVLRPPRSQRGGWRGESSQWALSRAAPGAASEEPVRRKQKAFPLRHQVRFAIPCTFFSPWVSIHLSN